MVTAAFTSTGTRHDRRPRAERLRCHRQAMEVALAEGCSLLEAQRLLAERAAQARWQATEARLNTRQLARQSARKIPTNPDPPTEPHQPARWMMFD